MPMQTGGRTHEGAGQCLYPSPHAEEGKLLMCVERVSSEEGNNMCLLPESQACTGRVAEYSCNEIW